jgi:tetratricopeptide (TPR) repeat protein
LKALVEGGSGIKARVLFTAILGVLVSSWLLLPRAIRAVDHQNSLSRIEKLFAERDDIQNFRQAVSLLEDWQRRDPSNYEVLWRLAKYRYYLSDRENNLTDKLKLLESGIETAKKAVKLQSNRPEGHFWLGANYGSYTELKGPFKSLWLIKTIRSAFRTVFRIDPSYENGAVYLALGEMEIRLPRLLGGNDSHGLALLEEGLKASPTNSDLKLFLAETYRALGKKAEARKLLESILNLNDPNRSPKEQQEIRTRARYLLDNG